MQNYHNLLVWKKAHALALSVHRLTQDWPRRDNAGLIGQVRRAALSIPANIAEGCGRATDRDFAKFIQIAIGSSVELEYHLEFASDAEVTTGDVFRMQQGQIAEVRRMLVGLLRTTRRSPVFPGRKPTADGR